MPNSMTNIADGTNGTEAHCEKFYSVQAVAAKMKVQLTSSMLHTSLSSHETQNMHLALLFFLNL